MNPKIKKTRDELERTKAKIAELQALVPQLERSITDMENTEIIRAVRSADIAPADLTAFLASLKPGSTNHEPTPTQSVARGQDSISQNDEEDETDV